MSMSESGPPGVLVLDGDPPTAKELEAIPPGAFIVAADGGANCLVAEGIRPDVVVGDMEGIEAEALKALEAEGVIIERHPEQKDDIDGLLALERLLEAKPSSVLVLGALGGRTAMALANLETLRRCKERNVAARILGRGEELHLVAGGERLDLDGRPGRVFNVVPDTPELIYTVRGSRYDVDRVTIGRGSSRGISNELANTSATIAVQEGVALVVVEP